MDDGGRPAQDVVPGVETAGCLVVEAEVVARVPGRVHRYQRDAVRTHDISIAHDLSPVVTSGWVEAAHGSSGAPRETRGERPVIGMRMGEHDRGDARVSTGRDL